MLASVLSTLTVFLAALVPGAVARGEVRVAVASTGAGFTAKHGLVGVEGVVLFPPAAVQSTLGLTLRAGQGRGAAFATEVDATGTYADGSIRAARVRALLPAALVRASHTFALVRGATPAPPLRLRVEKTDVGVRLDTGVIALTFAKDGPDLLPGFDVRGKVWRDASRPARVAATSDVGRITSELAPSRALVIEHAGPVTARVKASGFACDAEGMPVLAWTLRVEAYAGASFVTFRFDVAGLADVGVVEDVALELPLALSAGAAARVFGGSLTGPLDKGVARASSWDGRHVDGSLGTTHAGLDAARRCGVGADDLRGDGVGLVVSRLRPYAPRAVELAQDGTLRVDVYAGPLLLDPETTLMCRGALGATFARDPDARVALETEPRDVLFGLDAAATALPFDPPLALDESALDATPCARALARLDAALEACVGQRDFGDYRLGDGFANLEYDPARSFLQAWLGTKDAAFATTARAMVDHWVRFDRSDGENEIAEGLPYQHGLDHRSLTFEPGHVWAGGVVLAALLSGESDTRGAARDLARALVDVAQSHDRFDEERSYAWLLLALCDLELLGPNPQLQEARARLARELVARQDARGFFAIDRAMPGQGVVAVTPWVTGGITMEALYRAQALATDDATPLRDSLARAADFLAVHARRKDGAFADRVAYGADLGAEFQPQGEAEAVDELLICAGLVRALSVDPTGGWSTVVEERLVRALSRLEHLSLSPNEAARALVGLRTLSGFESRRTVGNRGR